VTAIGGDLGNSVLKCLDGTGDVLFGCNTEDNPAGIDRVEKFYIVPYADDETYISIIIGICKNEKITHIIPINEEEIKVVSRNIQLLDELKIKVVINNRDILDMFLDKLKTVEVLRSFGLHVPDTYKLSETPWDGSTFIVKHRFSSGSKLVKLVNCEDDLVELKIENFENIIVQRYIPSSYSEYTVGVFSDGNILNTIVFKRNLKHGYTQKVELSFDKSIEDLAKLLSENLDLHGYINIQLRKYEGQNIIFEINPRISGSARFRHKLGFCDVLWWLDYLDGKQIQTYQCQYKTAIGVRELDEKFIVLE
jgi:carbamoyl-phosphate synthase large subunit